MSRWTFKTKWFRDLAWWINLENSPNEIDDKQCINSINFNFSWNKLVNSKWIKEYQTWQEWSWIFNNWEIKSIDIIDWDMYVTYLDWTIKIMLWTNWNLAKINTNWKFYYIADGSTINAWDVFSITINSVVCSYTAVALDTREIIYNSLISQINSTTTADAILWESYLTNWTPDYTQKNAIWIQFFVPNNWTFTVSESWKWTLINSDIINNWFHISLFKSWDDLILINNSTLPVYYQKIVIWSETAYFWQYIQNIYSYIWTYYNGKFIFAWIDSNILYFSQTSSATEPWLVTKIASYDAGFQRVWWDWVITWIITWENWIYVFKEDEIYYSNSIQDDGESFAFVFNRITNNWAKDKYCITRVWQDIFYYDWINKKIRRLSYEQNLTTLRDTAVSNEIDELLQNQKSTINWIQQKLYYSYPNVRFATQTSWNVTNYNDIIYVYNVDTKSWTIEDNKAVKFWYWKYFSKENTLWKIFEDDYSYENDWVWLSKEYDLWDWIIQKRFWELEIYWKNNSDISLYLDVYIDWSLYSTFTITNNFWDFFRERYDLYQDWRYIQFWLRYEWVGYIEINEVNIKNKPLKNNFIDYNW